MSECRNCVEGSIQSTGFCDLCGFKELRFVEEWEAWSSEVDDQMEAYLDYAYECRLRESIREALKEAA